MVLHKLKAPLRPLRIDRSLTTVWCAYRLRCIGISAAEFSIGVIVCRDSFKIISININTHIDHNNKCLY